MNINKYIPVLQKMQMFSGVNENGIEEMLSCLKPKIRGYKKGEYILREGEQSDDILALVEGKLHIQKDDYWGNRSILGNICVGEIFGEAYATPKSGAVLNDVVAVEDSVILFFNISHLFSYCASSCKYHFIVVQNLFFAISEKNRKLVRKLGHMSKRSTREKLISYLSEESKRNNNSEFTIPFNRQQLADFLSVDRSAMSNELCKMRDEGMVEFDRNRFKLL